jgi:L-lactate dehydrogenase complex protein LldG
MKDSTSREKVLKRVRNALMNKAAHIEPEHIDFESEIYSKTDDAPEMVFAQKFTALTGKFAFCEDYLDFTTIIKELSAEGQLGDIFCNDEKLSEVLLKAGVKFSADAAGIAFHKTTITTCECLIARTGSIMVSSMQSSGRRASVAPDVHIVVAYTSQLVDDIKDGFQFLKEKYGDKQPSMVSMITGPSRTADIEKTLVLGAHGPKEIYLFLLDDSLPL